MAIIKESIEIMRPVDKVFAYTTDTKSWSKWEPLSEAEQTSQGPMGIGTTTKGTLRIGVFTMKWTAKVTEYEPNRKFGKNIICGAITNEQHNTYDPIEGGAKFTIVFNMKVGGLMKLFSPVMVSSMRKSVKKALNNLKGILEAQT